MYSGFSFWVVIVILQYYFLNIPTQIAMGVSKTYIFNSSQNHLAAMAKVLAHPARIAILQYIHKHQSCMCTDLVDNIGLSQPTISQHLNEIKKAGLLIPSFKGKHLYYIINQEKWLELQVPFHNLFVKLNETNTTNTNGN